MAETIGLFPIISGCDWKLENIRQKATVGRYNIYRLLMHLLTLSGSLPKSSPVDLDISGGEKNTSSNVAGTAIIVAVDNIVDAVQACPPEQLFQQTIATAIFQRDIYVC